MWFRMHSSSPTGSEPPPAPPRSKWKGPLLRLSLFYLILNLGLYFFQYFFLYQPTRMTIAEVEAKAAKSNVKLWPSGPTYAPENYRGFIAGPEDSPKSGTIVIFHGNAGDALDRDFLVPLFRARGLRVLLLEYPGYAARSGAVGERAILPAMIAALKPARAEFPGPFYILGESLGAGVAASAIRSSQIKIDGIALITPWDTLPDLAADRFWFVPARWLVSDRYDTIANLKGINVPIAIIIAEHDEIIPRRRSERLFASIAEPKQWIELPRVGHNNWPVQFRFEDAARLVDFWQAHRIESETHFPADLPPPQF